MIETLFNHQYSFFDSGTTKSYAFRMKALEDLKKSILNLEDEILEALRKDLNRSYFEGYATEVGLVLDSIKFAQKNLKSWMKIKRVKTPFHQPFSVSRIHPEPYGRVLVIAPFNYPFQLAIEPMIGAIAAGNTVILKPSELTPHTEAILDKLVTRTFDPGHVAVVKGGKETTSELIHLPFDYLFFTGSVNVGKVVMQAASQHLTPVTLELGGKSPTIVHHDANLKKAAQRIIWGKFINAGQTCIAPDYVYAHERIKEALVKEMKQVLKDFYGQDPSSSPDYGRIVNARQFDRLSQLIEPDKVLVGGDLKREDLYISPTLLGGVSWQDDVMADEIFGPLLPILAYQDINEVYQAIKKRSKPLALYLFTTSAKLKKDVLKTLSFGGGAINDTLSHVATPYMPFGGVGHSGMGAYHGQASFDLFSHHKGVLTKSAHRGLNLAFPPYGKKLKLVKMLLK